MRAWRRIGLVAVAALAAGAAGIVIALVARSRRPLRLPLADPRIVVRKGERRLYLYDGRRVLRTYPVALGLEPEGDKEVEGDRRTPLGEFYVSVKNPESRYHLSLGLSYPNAEDAARGLAAGLVTREEHDEILAALEERRHPPQTTRLGGEIYIHGAGAWPDWTLGCVALDDEAIEELFAAVPKGAPVSILA
jgi:murein L,D-transpeptidase YafK